MLGMQLDQRQGIIVATSGIDEFFSGSSTPRLELAVPQTPVQLPVTSTLADYPLYKPRLVEEVFGSS